MSVITVKRVTIILSNKYNITSVGSNTNTVFYIFTVPSVNVKNFDCTSDSPQNSTCSGQLTGDCDQYNGPDLSAQITVTGVLQCESKLVQRNISATLTRPGHVNSLVTNLIPGLSYNASVTTRNMAGISTTVNTTTFTTTPDSNVFHLIFLYLLYSLVYFHYILLIKSKMFTLINSFTLFCPSVTFYSFVKGTK